MPNLTCLVCISCVITAITSGASFFPSAISTHAKQCGCGYRCIAEHETECPNCAQEHGVIREIRRNNERLADQHDVFLSEVKEGGFEAVAGAFGRGLMNMGRVEEVV